MYQPKLDRVKEALGGPSALTTTLDRKVGGARRCPGLRARSAATTRSPLTSVVQEGGHAFHASAGCASLLLLEPSSLTHKQLNWVCSRRHPQAAERAVKAAYAAELQAQMRAAEEARLRDKMARMGLSPSHSSAATPSRGANPIPAARLDREPEYPAPSVAAGAADYGAGYGAGVGYRRPTAGTSSA